MKVGVRTVTCRVYQKRWQHQFSYRLCQSCLDMLLTILRENSFAVSNQQAFWEPEDGD